MDEKTTSNPTAEDLALMQKLMLGEGEPAFERAAGDVTFTVEQTCRIYLEGNNLYIQEILDTAHQLKTKGKSLLQDNEEFFEELQEIDEKMFYPIAACNLKIKAQSELEVETDQAIWYYEKTAEPTFMKLHKLVNFRNHKIMGLLTTQELEKAQIEELKQEVRLVPNVQGEVPEQVNVTLKWFANISTEAAEQAEEDTEDGPNEPILPIEEVSTSVEDLVRVYTQTTQEYYLRVLTLADTHLEKGGVPALKNKDFQKEYEAIQSNRQKVVQQLKLDLSDDEYEMAMMFYTQSQNKEFKKALSAITDITQQILAKLEGDGLTAPDVERFGSLLFTSLDISPK